MGEMLSLKKRSCEGYLFNGEFTVNPSNPPLRTYHLTSPLCYAKSLKMSRKTASNSVKSMTFIPELEERPSTVNGPFSDSRTNVLQYQSKWLWWATWEVCVIQQTTPWPHSTQCFFKLLQMLTFLISSILLQVGKTSLIRRFNYGDFSESDIPVVFKNYSQLLYHGSNEVLVSLWDTEMYVSKSWSTTI